MKTEEEQQLMKRLNDPQWSEKWQDDLDDELRTTRIDLCEICGKKVWWFNKFQGMGSVYHPKCIDARIKAKQQ